MANCWGNDHHIQGIQEWSLNTVAPAPIKKLDFEADPNGQSVAEYIRADDLPPEVKVSTGRVLFLTLRQALERFIPRLRFGVTPQTQDWKPFNRFDVDVVRASGMLVESSDGTIAATVGNQHDTAIFDLAGAIHNTSLKAAGDESAGSFGLSGGGGSNNLTLSNVIWGGCGLFTSGQWTPPAEGIYWIGGSFKGTVPGAWAASQVRLELHRGSTPTLSEYLDSRWHDASVADIFVKGYVPVWVSASDLTSGVVFSLALSQSAGGAQTITVYQEQFSVIRIGPGFTPGA